MLEPPLHARSLLWALLIAPAASHRARPTHTETAAPRRRRPASAFPFAGSMWVRYLHALAVSVMSTTSRLRHHIIALYCDMRNFSRWQPLRPPLRHGEGVRGRFLQQHRAGASDTLASSPQKRENQVIVYAPAVVTPLAVSTGGGMFPEDDDRLPCAADRNGRHWLRVELSSTSEVPDCVYVAVVEATSLRRPNL